MKRRDLLLILAALLAGTAISWWLREVRPLGEDVSGRALAEQVLQDRRAPSIERAGADLTVVVFTDYQCPACRKAEPALRAAAAKDGKVRIVFRDWPIFGERSVRAARVALAADRQGIYPAVHTALMRAPGFHEPALREAVVRAGGDWQQIEADLAHHGEAIEAALVRSGRDAAGLGIPGTPGYLIGTLLVVGAISERDFRRAFGEARSMRR